MGLIFKNPSKSAQGYVSQIGPSISPYYQPYIGAGNQAMSNLEGQYNTLLSNGQPLNNEYRRMAMNPVGVISQVGSQYHMTPGAQFQMQEGEDAIGNAQASGGMSGTPQDQQMAGQLATNLTNENFNDYMRMALGVGRAGLGGESNMYERGLRGEQQMNEMGYRASNQMASALAQSLMAQANMAYGGAANRNQHMGGLLGAGVHAAGSMLGSPGFNDQFYDDVEYPLYRTF